MAQTEFTPRAARRLIQETSEAVVRPDRKPAARRQPISTPAPALVGIPQEGESHEPIGLSPSSSSSDVFEHLVARIAVKFSGLAWSATSDQAKATLLRLNSHLVVLAVILGAVGITAASRPANSNVSRNVVTNISRPPSAKDDTNLNGRGGPILFDQVAIIPQATWHTNLPNRPRRGVIQYTVQPGDTLFLIAATYGLNPESVLWANYDSLKDNPDFLKPGMVLDIPPVNGIVYTVKGGDTVQSIAEQYKATADAIYVDGYEWNLLKSGQQPQVGASIIIPGGSREFKSWSVTQAVSSGSTGAGGQADSGFCKNAGGGLVGTGTFIWPADKHWLSGYPYTAWHLGIDIAENLGDPIYAADSGVVIYAGWNNWGYGNLVVIDHGNGWQTYYAHNSAIYVGCGQNVFKGNIISAAGSTGHSTGPHLHFETRFQGTLPNPFNVLPPP